MEFSPCKSRRKLYVKVKVYLKRDRGRFLGYARNDMLYPRGWAARPYSGSPSLWGAVGNLLPTEGAFHNLLPQRGDFVAAYRGRALRGHIEPRTGHIELPQGNISTVFRPLRLRAPARGHLPMRRGGYIVE